MKNTFIGDLPANLAKLAKDSLERIKLLQCRPAPTSENVDSIELRKYLLMLEQESVLRASKLPPQPPRTLWKACPERPIAWSEWWRAVDAHWKLNKWDENDIHS